MKTTKQNLRENRRLRILEEYKILDTENESNFDEITKLASEICNTPISLISFVDANRQWFKSAHGLSIKETPRNVSFCAHAIQSDELFIVEDAREDSRFQNSPLVTEDPNIVFYAGIPLMDAEGFSLGTLCVIDHQTKKLNSFQEKALKILSNQVIKLMELKRLNYQLNIRNNILNNNYKDLERFSHVISHDIKSPLNNILSLTKLLQEGFGEKIDDEIKMYINYIQESSSKLKDYIDSTLKVYKEGNVSINDKKFFSLNSVVKNCNKLLNPKKEYEINLHKNIEIFNHKSYFEQILLNLISNAIKYNDKPKVIINIDVEFEEGYCYLSVKDNGIGIEHDKLDQIFDMFTVLDKVDRFNNTGTGIGLSTVKSIVERIDGEIKVKSIVGVETEFIIKFKP